MSDSGAVAARLWDEWLPRHVRGLVAEALPGGEDDGRRLAVWLATVHDVGKATPAFACQVDGPANSMRKARLDMWSRERLGDDRRMAPHGIAGQLILMDWLSDRHGWSRRASGQFAVAVGGHHGVQPASAQIHDLGLRPDLLRTPGPSELTWRQVQEELLDAGAAASGVDERLADWQGVKLPQPVQVILGALVIVADWIASNTDFFPYHGAATQARRTTAAWRALDLPAPWAPAEPVGTAAELIEARFALPPGARARPVQEEAVRLAREMASPGLLIIEAPMGEGKTEAALAAAEILAARSGAGGVFMALPTRATGNAMFKRLLDWLDRPGDGTRSVFLAHAKAALDENYRDLLMGRGHAVTAVDLDGGDGEGSPATGRGTRPAELIAHQWLSGRKRGMLSSFAVGTIDQLLFAGLKSRHLALRHLALAGKVVVIDEVHAYDAYMSVYLERVLSWLGGYRVPVVMLSATLPAARRRALAAAYAGPSDGSTALERETGYPLLTAVSPGVAPLLARPPAASGRGVDVHLEALDDAPTTLADRLTELLANGGCALVIRNTVDRVLQTAELLRERFGPEKVTVAHSRFLDLDRANNDAKLLERFGLRGNRPATGHIVVASQVAEQSLDIDFDLLVTDLAPVDLVLQRMGRLHRHQRDRPPLLRAARCLVTGVDWGALPPEPARGSVAVYDRHTLSRSLAVLDRHLRGETVNLPGDISLLVQRAYGDAPLGPPEWAPAMAKAQEEHRKAVADKREAAEGFLLGRIQKPGNSLVGWVTAGVGDADDTPTGRAQVRDSGESLEVLVVQRRADGTLTTVPWLERGLGGLELPTDAVPPAEAARAVAASALRLPYHFTQPWVIDAVITELERDKVEAWQGKESHWLAGELILPLDEDRRCRLAGYELHYDRADGLRVSPAGARDVRLVNAVPSFDLVSRPWLPVQGLDGRPAELPLREVFARAGTLRRLVGDVPTQEFALLRLLLAIAHDALDGPEDVDAWEGLWRADDPFTQVGPYLDRHRERFDLLHPSTPFFQTADLHTASGTVSGLNTIVADVPNNAPFFTMRMPEVGRLTFAEAARWLVHAHAFDTSGIKSGADGDPRTKGGKGYPQGVGWAGNLGGVFVEGATLRETLLLNLIASDSGIVRVDEDDRPAWRRDPCGPATADLVGRPSGPRDLYTWQSRRLRLHHDGDGVHGVLLCYGDPLSPSGNMQTVEPMSGWRRSPPQEKKLGRRVVYMPREHDPSRTAWRGLPSLLSSVQNASEVQRDEAAPFLRPQIVEWVALLTTEDILPQRSLIRTRIIGARYGTQQSVIDEMVDDGVTMSVVLLHDQDFRYGRAAVDAVRDADGAVTALSLLAGDLAEAAGAERGPRHDAARDLGYGTLDGPFRTWLRTLGSRPDPHEERRDWQRQAHRIVRALADDLLESASPAAWEGRLVPMPKGDIWLDDTVADLRFRSALAKALHHPFSDGAGPEPTTLSTRG